MKISLTFLITLVLSSSLFSKTTEHISLFTDSTSSITPEEFLTGNKDSLFLPIKKGTATKNKAYRFVLKLILTNDSEQDLFRYIVLKEQISSRITMHHIDHDGKHVKQFRGLFFYGNDSTPSARNNFRVLIPKKDSVKTYIIFDNLGTVNTLDYELLSDDEHKKKTENEILFLGIFYGILILLILVNLFYFLTLKKSIFLIYSINVILTIFLYSFIDGMPLLNLMPHMGFWHFPILLTSISLAYTFPPFMAFHYLGLDNDKHKKWKIAIYGFFVMGIIAAIVPFIVNNVPACEVYSVLYSAFILFSIPFLFITIIKGRKTDKLLAKNFLIAYTIFVVFSVIGTLDSMAIIETSFRYIWLKIGTIVELVILSFSLAIRFRQTEQEYKIVQTQHSNLQERFFRAQINPHFIFNVLTSINSFINRNQKEEASNYLVKFSRLIRLVLDSTNSDKVVLEDEINMLKHYADLEKLRSSNHFDFVVNVDEEINALKVEVPAMLIQPYLENAIKHGVQDIDYDGLIELSIKKVSNELLDVVIDDNGIGIKTSTERNNHQRKGVGMQNVKERINILKSKLSINLEIQVEQKTEPQTGTIVKLRMPYTT